jgi:hypothetical protein
MVSLLRSDIELPGVLAKRGSRGGLGENRYPSLRAFPLRPWFIASAVLNAGNFSKPAK